MTGLSNPNDVEKVVGALHELGQDPEIRESIIRALTAWERRHQTDGDDIRDRVTGPIVDALHTRVPFVDRLLTSGVHISLPYTSKIAREFAMGEKPLTHVWEPQTTRLLVALAAQATTTIVGGAYAGDQAILMAQSMARRPDAAVHCFEVNPLHVEALRNNAARNGLENLVVNSIGLWDEPGFIELGGEDSHAAPIPAPAQTPNSFSVTTIADYARQHGISTIQLIMLDVEGGERRILRGAAEFLDQSRDIAPDIVFEIHSSYVDWSGGLMKTDIVGDLTKRGYEVYAIRDIQGHLNMESFPLELVTPETAYLEGPRHGFNMYATKRPETLARLNAVVCRNVSPKLLRHRLSHLHQPGLK